MMHDLLVMSQIAGRRCALAAHDVKSVIEVGQVTPIPQTPHFIAGVTAMRSQALTVIDCRSALGFDAGDWPIDHRAIVVTVEDYFYALRIDTIEDISSGMSEPDIVPGGFGQEWSRVATGMIETRAGPALLLDLSKLIAGPTEIGAAA